jgi:uncharacterized Tic20 family protein
MNPTPTTEERIWAVFSHLSALALGMGILLPILGWSEQRRKSKYASFQCLQALGYQSLGFTVWLLAYLLIIIIALVMVTIKSFLAEKSGETFDPLTQGMMVSALIVAILFLMLYMILPIIAAISCALGKDIRYPLIGDRLANYLDYEETSKETSWLIEEHEDRWVAAMGHFSVIIALWGLLAPITSWIVQGKRSAFLKFQSLQTAAYQIFVNILFIVAGFFYFLGVIVFFSTTGLEGNPNLSSPTGMAGLVIFGISSLCASLIILMVPLFHILGQWAGYRVLKGDDYHYPIFGRLVERRMTRNMSL